MDKVIKVGIGVVIVKNNKVLLGHRVSTSLDTGGIYEPDSWTCPGGKQEYEETILECAKRETKEETNLNVNDLVILGALDDISKDRHYVTITVLASSFTGELKVMEKDKIDKWEWFSLDNLPDNLYSPSKKSIDLYKKINIEKEDEK